MRSLVNNSSLKFIVEVIVICYGFTLNILTALHISIISWNQVHANWLIISNLFGQKGNKKKRNFKEVANNGCAHFNAFYQHH